MNELIIKKEKKKYKSSLIYNRLSFYSYSDDRKFDSLSFQSKYSYLSNFYGDLQKLVKMKPAQLDKIKKKKRKKEKVYNTVSELYNKRFEIILMDIMNYQIFEKISLIKISSL